MLGHKPSVHSPPHRGGCVLAFCPLSETQTKRVVSGKHSLLELRNFLDTSDAGSDHHYWDFTNKPNNEYERLPNCPKGIQFYRPYFIGLRGWMSAEVPPALLRKRSHARRRGRERIWESSELKCCRRFENLR